MEEATWRKMLHDDQSGKVLFFKLKPLEHRMLLCVLFLLWQGALGSGAPTEVVILTDDTFEHHTQAATGQTTGVW